MGPQIKESIFNVYASAQTAGTYKSKLVACYTKDKELVDFGIDLPTLKEELARCEQEKARLQELVEKEIKYITAYQLLIEKREAALKAAEETVD